MAIELPGIGKISEDDFEGVKSLLEEPGWGAFLRLAARMRAVRARDMLECDVEPNTLLYERGKADGARDLLEEIQGLKGALYGGPKRKRK
jgi:hypothetical protein